ncbi:hypothetical protein [Natronolimnobius baerhuensis]|uniref:Uncharacterized protein n=1 Tax=Natronolimnobius baerhuensis TaxID=253108 RepID=A0A202E743_9EURY|nr:hypothetical protein [Natronolimnobius baerhuensis]OVE84069.1 hypothetical protein B2G88_06440 [Natronolimnobius baerhuensis]
MVLETDLEETAAKQDDLPNAEDVYDRNEEIPLTDVFDDDFVAKRTEFKSFDELVAASPDDVGSAAELETVTDGEWDEFVAERTEFADEEELVMAARDHWVAKKLELA